MHPFRELRQQREALQPMLAALQEKWPPEMQLWLEDNEGLLYQTYPYLLQPAFPSVDRGDVDTLSLACRIFFESIFLADKIIDGHVQWEAGQMFLRVEAMQFEAYRLLQKLFPPEAVFWQRFRSTFSLYTGACSRERRFREGTEKLGSLRKEDAIEIARGKFPFARVSVLGMVELAGDDTHLEPLAQSIEHFDLASYYWDDLKDWKKDLRGRAPSLVIGHLLSDFPDLREVGESLAEDQRRFSRALYLDGAGAALLRLAIDHVDDAHALVEDLPVAAWQAWLSSFRSDLSVALDEMKAVVRRNRERLASLESNAVP